MKTLFQIFTAFLILVLELITACNSGNKTGSDAKSFEKLIEREIEDPKLSILLPAHYELKKHDGVDFTVYYFGPRDTSLINEFSGGIYFGGYPGKSEKPNDYCRDSIVQRKLLGAVSDWEIYNCDSIYIVQTIVENSNKDEWHPKIHAFGAARSKDEVDKLLQVFETLKRRGK